MSGAADDRDTTAAGLATARQILGDQQRSFWIDHQPVTNCEALTNEGGGTQPHARPRYRIADLLAENGYAYAWAGTDAEEPADGINLFDPTRLDRNPPVAFAHHATGELLVFASLWRSCSVSCFLRFYRPELLDVLTEARGLHVAHTYLEMDSQREAFRDNTLFDKTSGGLVLKPEVEALFSDFRERQERGAIWFAGITPILDHLRAMQQLEIRVLAPGRIQIHNPSGRLEGASFRLQTPPSGIRVDGRALPSEAFELEGEHAIFELDLEAGATRELSFPAGESLHYELVRAAE